MGRLPQAGSEQQRLPPPAGPVSGLRLPVSLLLEGLLQQQGWLLLLQLLLLVLLRLLLVLLLLRSQVLPLSLVGISVALPLAAVVGAGAGPGLPFRVWGAASGAVAAGVLPVCSRRAEGRKK